MPHTNYYPLFLDLRRVRCLVVGAGTVGKRKISALLQSQAQHILVLDLMALSQYLPQDPRVSFEARAFREEDLAGRMLVFAASDERAVNAAVASAGAKAGILCNCVDAPDEGAFIVPVSARSGRLSLALSTGGASPAYARLLREELEEWLQDRSSLAELLGRIRPLLLALQMDT